MATSILKPDFTYTYDGQLLEEILIKPSVKTPELTRVFRVMEGIKYKRQLMVTNPISKIIKPYEGCDRTFTEVDNPITNRTLEVKDMEANIPFCEDQFEATLLGELMNSGIRLANLQDTDLYPIITNMLIDAHRRDLFRIFCFGDTGSGSDDYSGMDGLFKTLFAAESDYCVRKIDTINSLNQTNGTRALDYLRNLHEQAETILDELPDEQKIIFVTPNVYQNLWTTLENSNLGTAIGLEQVTALNGQKTLTFRGVEILNVKSWKDFLKDVDNPYNGVFNTMILYTQKNNHIIGTDSLGDTQTIEGWYERKDRKVYFESRFKLGYQFVHCDLQVYSSGNV